MTLACAPAHAGGRPNGSTRDWFGQFGGGWAFPQGDLGNVADDDWTISGGAMYWPSDWRFGIVIEAAYVDFELSRSAINALNDAIAADPANDGFISGGDMDSWQLGLNGIWSIGPTNRGFYLTGGIGWYNTSAQVTQEGLVYYPPICSPWYWWCIPGGVGQGTFIVGHQSSDEFGWNAGAGYGFETRSGQFYVEAKYVEIQTDPETSTYLPLTIGFRW